MSERERWVVYPLLFLALGAALRDKIFNLTQSQTVVCESLAADRIHTKYLAADQIILGGRPLNPGGGGAALSPAQLLRLLQSLGVLREQSPEPAAAPAPPAGGESPPK